MAIQVAEYAMAKSPSLHPEEVSCDHLQCGLYAECVISPAGVPECACIEGYQGDGHDCNIVPSEVAVKARASPREIR